MMALEAFYFMLNFSLKILAWLVLMQMTCAPLRAQINV